MQAAQDNITALDAELAGITQQRQIQEAEAAVAQL